jgi:hypothetical protein
MGVRLPPHRRTDLRAGPAARLVPCKLRDKRSLYVWRSVYAQNPVAAEGNLFRKSDFRYWHRAPTNRDPRWRAGRRPDPARRGVRRGNPIPVATCAASSPSTWPRPRKRRRTGPSPPCGGSPPTGFCILLDQARQTAGGDRPLCLVRPLAERWAAPDVYIESGFIGSTLVIDATRAGLRVRPVTPDKDKVTRAIPATNRVRPVGCGSRPDAGWLGDWINELAEFPWVHTTTGLTSCQLRGPGDGRGLAGTRESTDTPRGPASAEPGRPGVFRQRRHGYRAGS